VKVWITRSQPGADRQAAALRDAGHEVVVAPVIRIEATGSAPPAGPFDVLVFLSEHAVRAGLAPLRAAPWFIDARAFAVGLVLHLLFPGLFGGSVDTGRAFFLALGVGFVALLVVPVGLVLVGLTVVGLPLALMGLAVALAALYLAGIQVAAVVGRALVGGGDDVRSFGLALLAGLAVLVVATRLPFVGGPLRVLVVLVGLGLLAERAWRAFRRRSPATAPAAG